MGSPTVAVYTKNLMKVCKGETGALDGIDLAVEADISFALRARPNNAGKTTTMRILATQLKPTAGERTLNPMSYVVDATRGLMITDNHTNLLVYLTAIAVFDIVMFILALMSFKRIIE